MNSIYCVANFANINGMLTLMVAIENCGMVGCTIDNVANMLIPYASFCCSSMLVLMTLATWLYLHTGRDGKAKPGVVQCALNANPAYEVHSCRAHITAHGAVHQTEYNIEENPL